MEHKIETADERHPLRFMVKFAFLVGLLFVAGRFLSQKKNEYAGLTESQARDKLVETMATKVGDDTAEDIADQVIPKLKERGFIKPDPTEAASDAVDEGADKLSEAVESVVED